MNELELKAILHERIVGIQTLKCLERVLEAINDIQAEEEDWWDDLSEEQKAQLEESIAHSYDPKNLIPHEVVKKKHAKWFSKEQNEQLKESIAESRLPENQVPYQEIKDEFSDRFTSKR
jgi:hypothetical protein